MKAVLTMLLSIILLNPCARAQEENAIANIQGQQYLHLRIKSLEKYNKRIARQQDRLLKKLSKKEAHLAHRLKNTDSAAYARYRQRRTPSFDSISKLTSADSATIAARAGKRRNTETDKLKGVQNFIESRPPPAIDVNGTSLPLITDNSTELNKLQTELNYRSYINDLITQRTNSLKSLSTSTDNIPGLTGIEKQVFYGKAKINAWKQIEEEPTKAEDKALEYLEGTEGFSSSMNQATAPGGMSMQGLSAGTTEADLQKMGFQTKDMLQKSLQQKFGSNLSGLAGNVGKQVTQFQSQAQDITGKVNDAKQTLHTAKSIRNNNKPSFKVNPMRGLPFWKRIEKQYNWQTTKATIDGSGSSIPATLTGSAMLGYKQTPKLVYGAGIATALGLGQNWNDVHFSFQGIGLRTYASWQWQYGIGAYAGYERMYKQVAFTGTQPATSIPADPSPHNTTDYNESILIGLTKSYNINSKWNGAIQVLYDIWWQQKGLGSPFVIRFTTMSK